MEANTKKWLKIGGMVLGGALGLFMLAMVVDKSEDNDKEEILDVKESTYERLFFCQWQEKNQPQSLPQIETHQHNTKKDYNTTNKELEEQNKHLEATLQQAKEQ